MQKRIILPMLVGAVFLGACGGKQAPQVEPPVAATPGDDEEARRRAEEERRRREEEERRRREEEERRRAEAEAARAREILAEMVFFDFDRYDIRMDAEATLRAKTGVLRANPDVRVRIEGHADERGSDEYNLALGMRRASAVRDFLVGFGLDASRFDVVSRGEEQPLDPRSNEEAWARNRRAEFHVISGQVLRVQ